MSELIFIGKCPRCGTVNDFRGELTGEITGDGQIAMPSDAKCFSCGLYVQAFSIDEKVTELGELVIESCSVFFHYFCQCPCHTEKGARCGFAPCCRHSGEVYAEKWPTLPVKMEGE